MRPRTRTSPQGLGAIFRAPLLLALASTIGLVAALIGDGGHDVVSWVALSMPVAAIGWAWIARRS